MPADATTTIIYSRDYPSDEYLRRLLWAREYHLTKKVFDGTRSYHAFPTLRTLCRLHQAKTLLDYGAGKGLHYYGPFRVEGVEMESWQNSLGLEKITPYDPAWPPYATPPKEGSLFDAVFCNDVLQYIPGDDMGWVLDEIFRFARRFVMLQVGCEQGKKPMGDAEAREHGRSESWWVQATQAALDRHLMVDLDVVLRIRGANPEQSKKCHIWRRASMSITVVETPRLMFAGVDNIVEPAEPETEPPV